MYDDTRPQPKIADRSAPSAKGLLSGDRGPCATAAPSTTAEPRRLDTHALSTVLVANDLSDDAHPRRVFARVGALQLRELQRRHGSWEGASAVAGGARVRA